jgi:hypothetical protein
MLAIVLTMSLGMPADINSFKQASFPETEGFYKFKGTCFF